MANQADLLKKVRQFERLQEQGSYEEALSLARSLVSVHKESALAFNTLGHALVHNRRSQNLPEALEAYKHAKSLAPNCMDTLKRYCLLLAKLGRPDEAAKELKKAVSVLDPDDPLKNQPSVHIEYKGVGNRFDRLRVLRDSLEVSNFHICQMQIKAVMSVEPAAAQVRKAKELVNVQSELVGAHHVLAYANLMFARQLKDNVIKPALVRTCDVAKKATEKFGRSLVMSLFLAKLLCLLWRYHDATVECLRGLNIENPSDPKFEDCTIMGTDHVMNKCTPEARIKVMKFQLQMLLNHITGICKTHWMSPARTKQLRSSTLVVEVDSLCSYYSSTDPSVARNINYAIRLYNEHGSHWVCPVLKCNLKRFPKASLLWNHLCEKHKDKVNLQSLGLKAEQLDSLGYGQILHLFVRQVCGKDVLYLTETRDMFDSFLVLPSGSCNELQQKKCDNASLTFKKVKDMMKALPNASRNEFTDAKLLVEKSLFKDCFVDSREYILPFVRMYQLFEVMKSMTEAYVWSITPSEIDSVVVLDVPGRLEPNVPAQNIVHGDDIQYTFLDYLETKETEDESREDSISDAVSKSCGETFVPEPDLISIAPMNWDPLPLVLDEPEEFEIENEMKLVMYDERVPVKGRTDHPFCYGVVIPEQSMSWTECVVGQRKPLREIELSFALLSNCEHGNILKPIGLWDWQDGTGSIIFPHLSGTLSDVPKSHLFTEEGGVFTGFTDEGYQAMSETFGAVHYINTHYRCHSSSLPLLPLRLSLDRIFHVKRAPKAYHILLGDTETRPEHLINANVEDMVKINWNALGNSLEILFSGCNIDEELRHLFDLLKEPTVNYEDLSWEVGLWDISTKMHFIREVFWCLEIDPSKVIELEAKPSLGLEKAVKLLGYQQWTQKNLYHDFLFLRNKILAHQDDPYHLYVGPKENIGVEKARIERFFRDEAPNYMLGLVKVVRELNWIKESPLLRSKVEYMNWFQSAIKNNIVIPSHAADPGPSGLALSLLPPQVPKSSSSEN